MSDTAARSLGGDAAEPRSGPEADAVASALAAVSAGPVPSQRACLELARTHQRAGDPARAVQWALATTDAGDDLASWLAAARIVGRAGSELPARPRKARVAVLGSYTTSQYAALLPVAMARAGADVEIYECGYGQYRQEVLDSGSGLYAFRPDVVVLAVHAGEVGLPARSSDPEAAVEEELARWTSLWRTLGERTNAHVVQHTFAVPPEVAQGHLATRTPGSRHCLLHRLNARLGEAAADRVSIVDCERLAGLVGKRSWFDARYYHLAKQAVGLSSVALLARHTAAVVGAHLGLARKCLVLDLDNTLWGGVLGEVGMHGIALGSGAVGEAYSAFQRYVLELKASGVVLAVCSKNNDADVREVFEQHPDMLLRLEDIAVFLASWEDKPSAVRKTAAALGVGLDSLVFVDDNPAEREAVRLLVPEVDVVPLPADPAGYVAALAAYPFFESGRLTDEDATRTEQHRLRAQAAALQDQTGSLEDYLASLAMTAEVAELDAANIARVVQLIAKTNQFNLTSRRHSQSDVESFAGGPNPVSQVVRLRDRFGDHGIVGVLLARCSGSLLDVDTWLLSCRVIGRTLEDEMMCELLATADRLNCVAVTGTYVPTAKNAQVAELYGRLGFSCTRREDDGATRWELRLPATVASRGFIAMNVRHAKNALADVEQEVVR